MNPYSLIARIKKSSADTSGWGRMLGNSENQQAEKAAKLLRFMQSCCESNPNGATAEFARNLKALLRPGADSRIDLASAYAGLEGMVNEILNQIPSNLCLKDCSEALRYDNLCGPSKYNDEILAPYRCSVHKFNTWSMLGEVVLCMAVINECRKVKKTIQWEYSDRRPKSEAEKIERFNKVTYIVESGVKNFYLYKLYAGDKRVSGRTFESICADFKKTQMWEIVFLIVSSDSLLNLKDFGMKLLLYSVIRSEARKDDSLILAVEKVCEYRNMLNHGALHSDEVKEHISTSRDERKTLSEKRKSQHEDAVAAMLAMLMLLVDKQKGIKISKLELLGYKLAYYASYAPSWMMNKAALIGTDTANYLLPKAISVGIPVLILIITFWQIGDNMTPKYIEPKVKLAAYDAMLDGDTARLIRQRNTEHIKYYNQSTRSTRESKRASETKYRLQKKHSMKFKKGRELYSRPGVDFYPMQSQLDDYMKTQLRILAKELVDYADGNTLRLGVVPAATHVELERIPSLHDMRYNSVEAYLRSILPPNISVERLKREEYGVSVDFYVIDNDA